jgi:hypothetical protein
VKARGGKASTSSSVETSRAKRHARTTARRDRQVVEIAALVVAGQRERAAGLAVVHTAEFPDDADLLARLART